MGTCCPQNKCKEHIIRALFRHSRVAITRLCILSLLSVLLIVLDHQQGHLARVRSLLSVAVLPIQYSVTFPEHFYQQLSAQMRLRSTLAKEVTKLSIENLELRQRLQYLLALEAENNSLKMLVKTATKPDEKVAVAEVLEINTTPFSQRIVINRGSRDGVYEGQPIVDVMGILGQVIQVGPTTSVVLLLTDKQHAIPVQSSRSGARALAFGGGTVDSLAITHVTLTADFAVGDVLVSSGLGQRFPRGYPVGVIQSINRKVGGAFVEVAAKPFARIDVARELLLIWPDASSFTADEGPKEPTPEPATKKEGT